MAATSDQEYTGAGSAAASNDITGQVEAVITRCRSQRHAGARRPHQCEHQRQRHQHRRHRLCEPGRHRGQHHHQLQQRRRHECAICRQRPHQRRAPGPMAAANPSQQVCAVLAAGARALLLALPQLALAAADTDDDRAAGDGGGRADQPALRLWARGRACREPGDQTTEVPYTQQAILNMLRNMGIALAQCELHAAGGCRLGDGDRRGSRLRPCRAAYRCHGFGGRQCHLARRRRAAADVSARRQRAGLCAGAGAAAGQRVCQPRAAAPPASMCRPWARCRAGRSSPPRFRPAYAQNGASALLLDSRASKPRSRSPT